eukprot:GSMAST32.ASY1.ANO1.1180.1 assembled CDS
MGQKRRTLQNLMATKARAFELSVGETPLVKLQCLSELTGCTILAKYRVAREIILDAEARGDLPVGGGGISLTLMARSHGHECHIILPDDVAKEKSDLLERFGASVRRVASVAIVNSRHYVNVAKQLAVDLAHKGAYFADQFENPSNVKAHYRTTGPEIWRQCAEKKSDVRIFLADPPGSALARRVNYGRTLERHRYDTIVEGVGLSRLTANFQSGLTLFEEAFTIKDEESVKMSRFLLSREGIFVGSSSGMNCVAAVKVARKLGPGHVIVTLLCDSGQRHLSRFWNEQYIRKHGIDPTINTISNPSCSNSELLSFVE